ncbi:hypothetical protein LSTR_LSTR008270 [Laodelphax striatellus]|uniref:Uncharacterized protein n=1 Tax=Laodelphax striatellus TaxID=195883 RepID=A0A482XNF2_LAOST|nr:hypothetical protein LSTR_LSTR013195 [Laodelphax striatellus]RZF46889.1 hypothetical protein LSTR_LSTR008270 [Laodelphax striatellus]
MTAIIQEVWQTARKTAYEPEKDLASSRLDTQNHQTSDCSSIAAPSSANVKILFVQLAAFHQTSVATSPSLHPFPNTA